MSEPHPRTISIYVTAFPISDRRGGRYSLPVSSYRKTVGRYLRDLAGRSP